MSTMGYLHTLTFVFGILGNVVSIFVYLSPVPTFYRIYKKKSTESFQSLPYLVSLFNCMLWLYYASHVPDSLPLVTVNSFGWVAATAFIAIYIAYAPKDKRISTTKLFGGMNVAAFSCILLLTRFLVNDVKFRVVILGWICVVVSSCVFAAPLSILARVIRTRSVEFMPFTLSFFLTLSAVLWSAYGLLQKDKFVAIPSITGIFLGTVQMVVYAMYRNCSRIAAVGDLENQTKDLKMIAVVSSTTNKSEVFPTNDDVESNVVLENLGETDAQVDDDQPSTELSRESKDDDNNKPETEVQL